MMDSKILKKTMKYYIKKTIKYQTREDIKINEKNTEDYWLDIIEKTIVGLIYRHQGKVKMT